MRLIVLLALVGLAFSIKVYGNQLKCKDASIQETVANAIQVCTTELVQADPKQLNYSNILLELAKLEHRAANYDLLIYYVAKLEASEHYLSTIELQYERHRLMGQLYYHQLQYMQSQSYFESALAIADKESNIEWLAKSNNDLGLAHYRQEQYKKALLHYKESLFYKEKIGDLYLIATTLKNIALLNKTVGDYPSSVQYYESSLKKFLEYQESFPEDNRVNNSLSHLYEDMIIIYSIIGDKTNYKKFLDRLLDSMATKQSYKEKVRALKNVALARIDSKEFEKVKVLLPELERMNTDLQFQGEVHYIKGKLAIADMDYAKAKDFYILALNELLSDHNDQLLVSLYQELYLIAEEMSLYSEALSYLGQLLVHKEHVLKLQYQSDIGLVKEQIEKERFMRQAIESELENSAKANKIKQLTYISIIGLLALLLLSISFFILSTKRKREREKLLLSIKAHEEKLFLLNSEKSTSVENENISEDSFRQILVDLMFEACTAWEQSTGTNLVELAEKSKIWKVSIDSGRLRTRSLDKYLNLHKLPANPRWKNVVKTCHFVLSEECLDLQKRSVLEDKLEDFMELVKKRSMASST
ncbi:MAG: tetratricopeptide repeat protein [Kangiellaceae bacterium]|nr:tetratricopeptide repeat protein [Kangiellaceae bacterium]